MKLLAIDWNETECRFVFAAVRKGQIRIHRAGTLLIETGGGTDSFLPSLARSVQNLCKEENTGNCSLLISLGQSNTERLVLTLPPCRESEIPLLLKNQVLRELPGCTDFDPLDFLILATSGEGHRVLALTVSLAFRQSLTKTFRGLGHPPLSIGFRAVNAAETVFRSTASEPAASLLIVNAAANDADLIFAEENRITALRSFQLPAENRKQFLAAEIERTLAAGLDGTAASPVELVVLFGTEKENELTELFRRQGLAVRFLNPFALPDISVTENQLPEEPEKFAPLIGSLILQSQRQRSARFSGSIDFLHPKESPPPPNYARPVLLACLLLGIAGIGLFQWNHNVVRGLEKKLEQVKKEHQQVAASLMQIQPSWNVLRQTQFWESQNVIWLDVLKELSTVLPEGTELTVTQMTFTTGPINNNPRLAGMISLTGMVREPPVLLKLQQDLQRSGRYVMQYPAPSPNPAGGGYPWLFRASVYRLR